MLGKECWVVDLCIGIGAFFVIKWILKFLCSVLTVVRVTFVSFIWPRNLVKEYGGKWAVVTGSTDGIGKEYGRQLAQKGMNIVLISRNLEKLKKTEEEIRQECGVDVHVIQADFSHGREIYERIAEGLKDKDIGVLVNNVGYFDVPGRFMNVSEEEIWRYVNVNMASVLAMTRLVLPQMLARNRGAIINISSMFGLCPIPFVSTYAATKAFVSSFSHALEYEYRQSGITVQTVHPSFIKTNMLSSFPHVHNRGFIAPKPADWVSSCLSTLGYYRTTGGTWGHAVAIFILTTCNRRLVMYGFSRLGEFLEANLRKTS
ncbi:hypothetical protein O3P69_013293 [Scylla paramamosain]|uniref:Uncharacterized protein n=1 Tax=Scylla paramamosain TaxID=85552 RepID=A0AAW0U473_SCYPA